MVPVPKSTGIRVAPLTRGWTQHPGARRLPGPGCPAHAGMDPACSRVMLPLVRLPRSRGDGPVSLAKPTPGTLVAPLTRGWTQARGPSDSEWIGCPAHAGMDPAHRRLACQGTWLPRSRGDGPLLLHDLCGGRWVAPLTRGWTQAAELLGISRRGCPAHAGMDLHPPTTRSTSPRLPRSRGDGPVRVGLSQRDK